jgi:hypothetical protein
MNSDRASSERPATIGGFGPILSESRPASGATATIISVDGRKRTPACSALKSRMFCM